LEFGLDGTPCSDDIMPDKVLEAASKRRPYELESHNQERWHFAFRAWGRRLSNLRIDPRKAAWIRQLVRVDSAIEALAWLLLLAAGAKVFLGNPHLWGFRLHPLVDSLGACLGERVLPGLYLERENGRIWIWPQVHLRPKEFAFRPDALVLIVSGNSCRWCILEIDGYGHNSAKDLFRQEQLKMHEFRFSKKEIEDGAFLEKLLAA
ncbi:MAG: hypothetical protein KF760_04790, partial [Candidatus Eremiobacteraeota bacterium]|nr:hypothetical protein [Candidatus Eremiobacteraeota bacterium]